MVVPESPEHIRAANPEDVPGILQLLEPLEQQGILVKRSREELERDIERFFVIEAEGNILGCAALYPFAERKTAELAALAVNPFYRDGGRGERLLAHAEARARALGMKSLFVLSTRAPRTGSSSAASSSRTARGCRSRSRRNTMTTVARRSS